MDSVDHNHDGNEDEEYNDQHMKTMSNIAFRYEETSLVPRRIVHAKVFYNMLQSAQQPLYEGYTIHSELSTIVRLLSIKFDHNMSN